MSVHPQIVSKYVVKYADLYIPDSVIDHLTEILNKYDVEYWTANDNNDSTIEIQGVQRFKEMIEAIKTLPPKKRNDDIPSHTNEALVRVLEGWCKYELKKLGCIRIEWV
jgi:uncharacterized UPF0160 family protein